MSKDTFYFRHDYNARNDPKMVYLRKKFKAEGISLFWTITEMLHECDNHELELENYILETIAEQSGITDVEQVLNIINFCCNELNLFIKNDKSIYSKRVNDNINYRFELSQKRSKAGKISAEIKKNTTSVEQVLTDVEQTSTKKRKEKERIEKEYISFETFWNLYDKKIDKVKSEKHWKKLDIETQQKIIDYIPKYKAKQPDSKFRKNPTTFFNNQSWLDDIEPPKQKPSQSYLTEDLNPNWIDPGIKPIPEHLKNLIQ